MSRSAKRERRALIDAARNRSEANLPATSGSIGNSFMGFGSSNGHQGADTSRLRGYVYFPELDTRREISSYTRLELLRKARFLYANHGIAKRIVNGLARMVAGTGLTPQAATLDKAWNALAEAEFAQRSESQFVFDVGGRYDFYKSQQAQLRFRYRDGDAASILTESEAGGARFAFYEGHQIGNAAIAPGLDQTLWRDGVRHDRHNRALAYRFLGDNGSFTDVPSDDVIFFCDYERAGQGRGVTVLSHAVNHLLDSAEITGYIKTGVKLANQYGYWIEYAQQTSGTSATATNRGGTQKISTPAGPVTLDRIYGAGAIPDLPPGASLKFNASSHPHPNNLSLIEFLIRDIAWGVGLSPEVLWNIAALGGANTRFVLADTQGWIEEQQAELVRLYCSRVWIYTIAKAMKTGRLRRPTDPEWWKHSWITPPRLTVDFGRDGKLHLEQLKMGVITYSRLLGWQGQDFEAHTDKWLDEIAYVTSGLKRRNLTWADLQNWRNVNAQPSGANTADAESLDAEPVNNDPNAVADSLSRLLKNPEAARRTLDQMRRTPEDDL
ncbi:MAG TPA: phage portal protein [Candidatus Synoicihabitans sp.]|nr:phage portal protein [Candidatus Synoicihabitans sp.]